MTTHIHTQTKGWKSSVGIVVRLQAGQWRNHGLSLTHSASCLTGSGSSFPSYKAASAQSWPLTPIYSQGKDWVQQYYHSQLCLHGMHKNNIPTTIKDVRLKIKENFNLSSIYISLLFNRPLLKMYLFLAACVWKNILPY